MEKLLLWLLYFVIFVVLFSSFDTLFIVRTLKRHRIFCSDFIDARHSFHDLLMICYFLFVYVAAHGCFTEYVLYIFFFSGFIVAMNLFSWNIAWKIVLIKIWWHVKFYVRFYPYQWGLDGSTWNIVCRKIEIFPSIQSRTDPFGRTVYIY